MTDQPNAAPLADARINAQSPLLQQARDELLEYFDARRRRFGLPLAPAGTEFQRAVWAAIALIEPGRTVSYAELALMLGSEDAVRAVAQAGRSKACSPTQERVVEHIAERRAG